MVMGFGGRKNGTAPGMDLWQGGSWLASLVAGRDPKVYCGRCCRENCWANYRTESDRNQLRAKTSITFRNVNDTSDLTVFRFIKTGQVLARDFFERTIILNQANYLRS